MGERKRARNATGRRLLALAAILPLPAFAAAIPTGTPLEEIVVTASRIGRVGDSALSF